MNTSELFGTLKALLLACCGLISYALPAQLPGMKVYTQLDGFPGTVGYLINQDEKGFIWIGTDNGVACFDGKKFRVFDDKDGLVDKEVLTALPYSKNHVLFLPLLNNVAYCKNRKVVTKEGNKNLRLINNATTNVGVIDFVTKKAWIGDAKNNKSLYCISDDSLKKVQINIPNNFHLKLAINNTLYLACFDNDTPNMLGRYDLAKNVYTPLDFAGKNAETLPVGKKYIWWKVSEDGKYAIGNYAQKQVDIFEIQGNKLFKKAEVILKDKPRFIIIDRNNHLWIAPSNSGVEYWGALSEMGVYQKPLYFFEDVILNHLYVDRNNNIWFTTEQKGFHFISAKHWGNAKRTLQVQLPSSTPKCITADKNNNIFIGLSGKSSFTIISHGKSKVFSVPETFPLGIRCILDDGKQILMGGNVLIGVNTNSKNLLPRMNILWDGSVKDIARYDNEHLLLAQHSSVAVVKSRYGSGSFSDKVEAVIFSGRASALAVLPDGSILIGTPNGVYRKASLYVPHVKLEGMAFDNTYITDIETNTTENILIGTNSQGLFSYNYLTGHSQPILLSKNKTLGHIRHIFKQNNTDYWISTDNGLYKLSLDGNMMITASVNYSFFDGLPSNNVLSAFVLNDTAYIATASGMGILPFKNSAPAPEEPILWLTMLKVEDSLIHFPGNEINLNHRQNNIQLSLSAISFESIGTVKYLYRLKGLSDKWVETENPEISFSGLSPGSYLFEVHALNYNGIKTNTPLVFSIIIHPAFWQTIWFRILLFIVTGAFIILIVYKRVIIEMRKKYYKMQQKKRLAELELEAIKAQINPHFVYNCLNSVQYFSYTNDLDSVKHYLDIFARLIRQTMQYSQETFITLEEEINYLKDYLELEQVRYKENLTYHFQIDENLNQSVLIPSMLVQPYVENAMKHGIAKLNYMGKIWIRFTRSIGGGIKVTVEDNGPGLQNQTTNTKRKPLGMRITGTRATSYNQLFGLDIRITIRARGTEPEKNMQGTIVELFIPPIAHGNTEL